MNYITVICESTTASCYLLMRYVLAFDTGCFPILLKLCDHINSGVSLVATSTLCLLAECAQNHSVFISQEDALRSLLMRVTKSVDEQVWCFIFFELLACLINSYCGNFMGIKY